jgi:hypothetical protein
MKRVVATGLTSALILISMIASPVQAVSQPEGDPIAYRQGHPNCGGISYDTPSTPECDALIAAQPAPNVTPLAADFGVLADSDFIRFDKDTQQVPLYDEPNGTIVDYLTSGYTYVTVRRYNSDVTWAEVRPGRWVNLEGTLRAQPSSFAGVQIHSMDMPFAFVLWRHCATTGPNGPRNCEGENFLQRFQIVNIYATVNVAGWDWHLIGPGRWTNQQNLSIIYPAAPLVLPGRWVAVNTYEQNLVAYDGGTPRMATLVSTGVPNGEWDTWPGTFDVRLKIEKGPMDGEEGEEDYYSLDDVPYHMYFNGLIALHGAYWHNSFGYPHSHGCVNLSITDSKWLYENWVNDGTKVYVYASRE